MSFKFATPSRTALEDDDVPLSKVQGGKITFKWLESSVDLQTASAPHVPKGTIGSVAVAAGGSKKAGVGALATTKGIAKVPSRGWAAHRHVYGSTIAEVEINYCSEAGLVCKGIVTPGEVPFEPVTAPPQVPAAAVATKREPASSGGDVKREAKRLKKEAKRLKKPSTEEIIDLRDL